MGVSQIAVVAAISLSGLLPSSCIKAFSAREAKSVSPATNMETTVARPPITPSNARDLGELTLTNRFETRIDFGGGRSCTIMPRMLDHDNLQLTLAVKSNQSDGKTTGLIVTQVTTRPGKSFEVAIGDLDIMLTPQMAQKE